MKLKHVSYLLNALSLAALLTAVFMGNTAVATGLTLLCLLTSLALLYPRLAELSHVSEDSPRVRSLRSVTIFNAVFVAAVALLAWLWEHFGANSPLAGVVSHLTDGQRSIAAKFLLALVLAVPMLFLGNAAPQIPFNRYTGLRLPWTVRDEETWIVAHRVLGYVSLPLALLVFANVPTDMPLDMYARRWWLGAAALWLAIPGLISAVFYCRKWRGTL